MFGRCAAAFVVAMLAIGCAGNVAPDPVLQETTLNAYRLDSGDRLRVTVFGQPDMSGEFNVDGSGLVALPLIEPMRARGETPEDFARELEAALGRQLLRSPSVSVEVTLYRPFFILGEVNRPGQYAYVNGMTVKTAAAIAGGFTYRANTSVVLLTRQMSGKIVEGAANLNALVLPGDTVLINERLF